MATRKSKPGKITLLALILATMVLFAPDRTEARQEPSISDDISDIAVRASIVRYLLKESPEYQSHSKCTVAVYEAVESLGEASFGLHSRWRTLLETAPTGEYMDVVPHLLKLIDLNLEIIRLQDRKTDLVSPLCSSNEKVHLRSYRKLSDELRVIMRAMESVEF